MPPVDACPSADLLRRSLDPEGPLAEEERRRIESHVDRCEQGCKQAIAALLRGNTLSSAIGTTPRIDGGGSFASSIPDEPPPAHLGRYRIMGRLGAGGMGVVWRGYDPQLGRDVAVKVPNLGGSDLARAAVRERFLREARAAATVRHAHVCPIYDIGEQDGRPFVVMALVEGESLAERLRRQCRFEDPRDAVQLVLKVAEGLACVHAANIVHRDLKPGNILLDRAGEPFLSDFGLARGDDLERLSSAGQIVGTPAYMAPEQAQPELGAVGPRSDQYSLGVVLYQMLTGRLPFEGENAALLLQLGSKSVPPPSQHRADLDPLLERALLKSLSRSPQHRYASVPDFAAALRAWKDRAGSSTPRPSPAAQHRRLTLLQCGCDLFDSPALLETLDPEQQHELLFEFQQLCRDVAAPLAGTVVKPTDHGLLICFGVPSALECAARRAVRAGRSLLDRMADLNERLDQRHKGLRLAARVAIHSDRALVAQEGGGEALSIVGQVLPVVDQLERLAEADSVLISEETHQILKGFVACTSLGPHKLKGAAAPRTLYRVEREARDFAECASHIPLIGRDRETALIQDRWEQAARGTSHVVLLSGEAGIGKSRQVRVLKEHVVGQSAADRAALIIEWPCTSLQEADGHRFHAIASMERIMGIEAQDVSSRKLEKLAAHLASLGLESDENAALLASLLSIPLDGRSAELGLTPLRQKEKTFDLLLDWLRTQAERQPVLFIIEDLHWAGPTTLEFLELLVGQAQDVRLLTLLTFRPEFSPPWRARSHHTQLALNRLTRQQTAELMLSRSHLPAIPQSLLDKIAERTDGVPLFVEEFTAMMLESGALSVTDGEVRLSATFDADAIPATLQDLLMARLDRIGSDLEVVQLAATIGREFRYELLSAVASCGEEQLQQELSKLIDAELLFQQGRPPAARYQFKHALIRDAAYQALLKTKRQEFHRRVAETLEQGFQEICGNQPELLGHHFTAGNAPAKSVEYWAQAGERADQRGAYRESVGHFRRGLDAIGSLTESHERHAQEIRMQLGLSSALQIPGRYGAAEVEAALGRANDLSLLSDWPALRSRVLYSLFLDSLHQARHSRALELGHELLTLAEREQDPAMLVGAHRALGATLFFCGNLGAARSHLEMAIAALTPKLRSEPFRAELFDPLILSHSFLSWTLHLQGYPERAAACSREVREMVRGLGYPFGNVVALGFASWLDQFDRDLERTSSSAQQVLGSAIETGIAYWIGWGKTLCGWTLAERGRADEGVAQIRHGIAELGVHGVKVVRTYQLALLAEACARAGRAGEGLQALAEAQELVDANGERYWQAEIHRLNGELLLQCGAPAETAEPCFEQALDVARAQEARSLELRAALSLGELWRRQGKTQPARELVAGVYAGFTEGFQTRDLQRAAAFLDPRGLDGDSC